MNRLYVHEAQDVRMRVVEVADPTTPLRELLDLDPDDLVWSEAPGDEDEAGALDADTPAGKVAAGTHLFKGRCRKIKTTLRYGGENNTHPFGPNVKLARVLRWTTGKKGFDVDPEDADELGLQVCGTDERPDLSEHLGSFAVEGCAACFDLVPKDRFQG